MTYAHHPLCPVVQVPGRPEPCVCVQLETAERDTADRIAAAINGYATGLTGKREQSVALTCAALAVPR